MHGLHLTADLRGCSPQSPVLTRPADLRAACLAAVDAAGLHAVAELFHRFAGPDEQGHGDRDRDRDRNDNGDVAAGRDGSVRVDAGPAPTGATGITGVVLLAESHLAVHTWPEDGAVTLDVYVCNRGADNAARAEAVLAALIGVFAPAGVERHALVRGATVADAR